MSFRGLAWPLVVLMGACSVPVAHAYEWGPDGIAVCGSVCVADNPKIVADGQGGAYVAWRDRRDPFGTDHDVYLQRITAAGMIAPGWPEGGVPVCVALKNQSVSAVAPDGAGGALVLWIDMRDTGTAPDIYVHRVLGDGTFAPGWPENGVAATRAPNPQSLPHIIPDGAGGAYVAWDDRRDRNLSTTLRHPHREFTEQRPCTGPPG